MNIFQRWRKRRQFEKTCRKEMKYLAVIDSHLMAMMAMAKRDHQAATSTTELYCIEHNTLLVAMLENGTEFMEWCNGHLKQEYDTGSMNIEIDEAVRLHYWRITNMQQKHEKFLKMYGRI